MRITVHLAPHDHHAPPEGACLGLPPLVNEWRDTMYVAEQPVPLELTYQEAVLAYRGSAFLATLVHEGVHEVAYSTCRRPWFSRRSAIVDYRRLGDSLHPCALILLPKVVRVR